jgi:hypothetical protein
LKQSTLFSFANKTEVVVVVVVVVVDAAGVDGKQLLIVGAEATMFTLTILKTKFPDV